MKGTIIKLCVAAMMLTAAQTALSDTSYLPVVQKNGENCYYYSAEKGESVYGIVNKFGWDTDTFMRYNPDASELKGGQVVYYPCVTDKDSPAPGRPEESSVAAEKQYTRGNIPEISVSELAKATATVRTGSATVAKDVNPEKYKVRTGDTFASITKAKRTGIKALFRGNPGLTPENLESGAEIMVFPGTDMENAAYRNVTEQVRSGQKKYKVKQKDTWQSIARKNHIDTLQLKDANPEVKILQKGTRIVIPHFKDTVVNRLMPVEDVRVNTPAGLSEIYREARTRLDRNGVAKDSGTLDVTVLVSCDDSNGRRRDLEFLRGFMLGLEGHDRTGTKIRLKGVDLADYGSLSHALRSGDFDDVDVITCSVDRDFPEELVSFCKERGIMLVNVFDAKTDISSALATGVQLLPPSSYFYDRASDFLTRVMSDRTFIFVDYDSSDDDNMSGAMMQRLQDSGIKKIVTLADADALAAYSFNPASSYTVISDAGTKDNISKTLGTLEEIVDKYPNMPLSIVGRPNWMVYSTSLEKLFRKLDTYIPSRFLFDDDSQQSRDFTSKYKSFFKSAPLRSMPMYSVMGYDVATYFVDQYLKTGGDLNYAEPAEGMLQLDFRLDRPEVWDGFMNRRVYLLHFTPFATTDKISL